MEEDIGIGERGAQNGPKPWGFPHGSLSKSSDNRVCVVFVVQYVHSGFRRAFRPRTVRTYFDTETEHWMIRNSHTHRYPEFIGTGFLSY